MRNWFPIGLMALLAVGVAGLLTVEVRGALHDRGQQRGTVTVNGCTFLTYGRHGDTYRCGGRFVGDGFTIPYVTFDNLGPLDDGATARVAVSGPGDDTADLVSEGFWRAVVTLGGAVVLLGLLIQVWRLPWRTGRSGSLAR